MTRFRIPCESERMDAFALSVRFMTSMSSSADGKVEKMETLRAITSDTGRIVYALKELPSDLAAIEAECPGVRLSVGASFQDARGRVGDAPLPSAPLPSAPLPSAPLPSEKTLVAEFGDGLAVETVNAALLPRLVPFGVIAVTPGRSLEEAYLGK